MVATPPEEILKQHEEACRRIKNDERYSCHSHGEIPLKFKQNPVCDDPSRIGIPGVWNGCISTRGFVDVTPLANLVREGYNDLQLMSSKKRSNALREEKNTDASSEADSRYHRKNLWDSQNARIHNVDVMRPSHDGWGIGKIVLIFCDDFLSKIYEMPWWHARSDIREAIQPVLNTLQIHPDQVVRLLLANLPPSTTIPHHHDTGAWVKHTHRVHVPILVPDPSKVLFTCGPTVREMERIRCTPGHVFEINNQAKHAVSNCCTVNHRVHLILDHVDRDYAVRHRYRLQPGEQLVQTRRSIDRMIDIGSRPTPSFFILGAQKGGTTSLYNYMIQHPLVIPAKRRETHCLDWRWNHAASNDQMLLHQEHCLKFYHAAELNRHPSCLTGDSTPSYLLDAPRVISRMKQVFPHFATIKFFVMTRNPIHRAISHYAMVTSTDGTPQQLKTRGTEWRSKSFDQVVKEELTRMNHCGLIPYWNMESAEANRAAYWEFINTPQEQDAWIAYLKESVPLNTGSHSLLARGMYALQIQTWMSHFKSSQFLIIDLDDMSKDPSFVLAKVWNHLDIPHYEIPNVSPRNQRDYDSESFVGNETLSLLERFYELHQERFQSLLTAL